jgi:GT2 family glycosyltransferase
VARVDVVIATFNRPGPLIRCLDGLAQQRHRDLSVLVVDDSSTLAVEELIPARLFESLDLRVLRLNDNGGPGRARNLGVASSSGDFLAFIDDDIVPDPELIATHLSAFEAGPDNAIQFGPLKAPADWKPSAWNLWEAQTLEVEYRRMLDGVYAPTWRQFFTGNAFLPRTAFQLVGGFNEEFIRAEDIEFACRLAERGSVFRFVPGAIGWHYANRSRESWRGIARGYARFDLEIDRLHPELNWAQQRELERASRNRLSRFGYACLRAVSRERFGAGVALNAGAVCHRAGAPRLALPLLSFAYSVEYESTTREILQSRSGA